MDGEAVYEQGELVFDDLQHEHGSRARFRRLSEILSLESRGLRYESAAPKITNRKRCHMVRRSRSLNSGQFAKALAVDLAFKDRLQLV